MESGVYGDTGTVVSRTIVFYFLSSPSCHALDGRNETNDIYIYRFGTRGNSKGLATMEGSVFRDI